MRITEKMISTNYMASLNNSLSEVNRLNERVTSGRKYQKGSEDPASALKAYQVRSNLSRIDLYQNNVEEVKGILSETETAYTQLSSILSDVNEQILQGSSDTNSEDRQTFADVLKNYQSQVFSVANASFSSKYVFGGSDLDTIPFSIDASGKLLYHGLDVNDDTLFDSEEIYYDIGMGLKTDGSGNIVKGTALNIASPGSELLGVGTDTDGLSNNLYNLLGQVAELFESNDMTDIDKYSTKLQDIADQCTLKLVNVGQKTNFVEFLETRYEADEYNATVKQKSLEGVDNAKAILEYNTQNTAYQAALAMGVKIMQPSLLDYLS